MKSVRYSLAVAAVLGAGVAPLAAQSHDGQMQHAQGPRERFAGTVVGIDTLKMDMAGMHGAGHQGHGADTGMAARHHRMEHERMTQGGGGLALRIARATDTVAVHLGPLWYLKQQNPDGFAAGDQVTVDAVEMKEATHPHWMAYAVTKGDLEIALRNDEGTPRWMEAMRARMKMQHGDSGRRHHPPS